MSIHVSVLTLSYTHISLFLVLCLPGRNLQSWQKEAKESSSSYRWASPLPRIQVVWVARGLALLINFNKVHWRLAAAMWHVACGIFVGYVSHPSAANLHHSSASA